MEQLNTFGKWLKRQRRLLDLTQQELADQVGCSLVTIRKFEADERRPSKQLAELLAVQLQIPTTERPAFIAFARTEGSKTELPPISSTPPAGSPPNNLPAALTSLIGRTQEIETICQTLLRPGVRLLTLTGPGGSGKTRLAQEVARALLKNEPNRFPGGIYFVNLTTVNDPNQVIPVIGQTLELKESGSQTPTQLLHHFLRSRQILLVLDNFEQVVEASEPLFDLLNQAAGLQLLITSRTLLQLYGEHEYPVPALALPNLNQLPQTTDLSHLPAIALFVERAQAVKPTFSLNHDNGATIAEICVRLDGLPLAIELAAARSKSFSPIAILGQLAKQLDFLASANRHITGRQRTLRGAIDWSFNLLDNEAKQLFARLGLFVGPFTPAEADSIAGPNPALFNILTSLANQSMIQQIESDDNQPSFQLLLTLREYALEQLAQTNELANMQARHGQFYLALAEQGASQLTGPEQANWLRRLSVAHDNFRAALAWSQQHHQTNFIRLAIALTEFWKIRGYFSEGRTMLDIALGRAAEQSTPIYATTLSCAGLLAYVHGDYAQAHTALEMSLHLWQELNDKAGIATTLFHLGRMAWTEEQYELSWNYSQQALAIEREAGNLIQIAMLLNNLGLVADYHSQRGDAKSFFEESLAIARQVGNKSNMANCLNNLGTRAQEDGNYQQARDYFEESLEINRELGYKQNIAVILGNLGNTGLKTDDLQMAEERYLESLALRRQLGARLGETQPLHGLGVVAARRQDYGLALHYYEQSLAIWQETGRVREIPSLLEAIGGALAKLHRPEAATRLMGAAERIRQENITAPQSPHSLKTSEETITLIKGYLDIQAFMATWQSGREMTIQEAVSFASQITHHVQVESPAGGNTPSQRYTIDSLLAVGGMGKVYVGHDTTTNDKVVIKRLKPNLLQQNPEIVARFAREGELLRQLNHPNIVKMLAVIQDEGDQILVLEYVAGGSLRDLLNRQPQLPVSRVLEIGLELADALTRAHHLHIIHRDLKPENVLLAEDGSPRLTDFGISYQLQPETRLTQPGAVLGTTAYVAPEGYLGEELEARSDIWSFGVLLYEMLAGRHPFQREHLVATLTAILQQPPLDLLQLRPDTPLLLGHLINQMLAKDRQHRPGTMRQVAARLEEIQVGGIH